MSRKKTSFSRELVLRVRKAIDDFLPPVLRDARWLMAPALRLVLRGDAHVFMDFKERAYSMTDEEFSDVYARVAETMTLQGETDLNRRCTDAVLDAVQGPEVLEVGCGRGYLAGLLSEHWSVTACDIVVPDDAFERLGNVTFKQASIEQLPFEDRSFDTVVCTHTLEHVRRLSVAIDELRRVARRRLIVVVPRERPYKYSFNLHLHFFPYRWSLESVFGQVSGHRQIVDLGDWFYVEDLIDSHSG